MVAPAGGSCEGAREPGSAGPGGGATGGDQGEAPLLEVLDLGIDFLTPHGPVRALRGASLVVPRNRVVGLVGESGSGKTTLVSAVLRLLPENAVVRQGSVRFQGTEVLAMDEAALRGLRGRRIAMVFQDPMTSLNPVLSIATQMVQIQYREPGNRGEKRARAVAMLRKVGIPDAEQKIDGYPHELSGGMRQRVAIAMALLMSPDLLIADEPTTALDVTLEAQIIHLLRRLRAELATSILFVSHNLGLVAELCDEVVVMYAGEIVEKGSVEDVFHRPGHPYTRALLACDPSNPAAEGPELAAIPGDMPDLTALPSGCVFHPRCPEAIAHCPLVAPAMTGLGHGHAAACHLLARQR